jgi:hypothetical protein
LKSAIKYHFKTGLPAITVPIELVGGWKIGVRNQRLSFLALRREGEEEGEVF